VPSHVDILGEWMYSSMHVVSFTLQLLYSQGRSPWYLLDRRLGGPQSSSGHGGEEKNSQFLLGIKP